MTPQRLAELRREVRAGTLPRDLVDSLQAVARRLVRLRLLPPAFAPYGSWDAEAADEIFQSWYERRLLVQGHLQLLLDRAQSPAAFERLAERSLRQHLARERDRSQARNLYARLLKMLEERDAFTLTRDATRPQDRWWAPAGSAGEPWTGDDQQLVSHAWALGDFTVIRYRAHSRKHSPLLDAEELERFVRGLMEHSISALTPTLIMRALEARFALTPEAPASLEARSEQGIDAPGAESPAGDVQLRDTARALLAELSSRQAEVLARTVADEPVETIAAALRCSAGTVVNERRRIGIAVTRFSADENERVAVLNATADLVYQAGNG